MCDTIINSARRSLANLGLSIIANCRRGEKYRGVVRDVRHAEEILVNRLIAAMQRAHDDFRRENTQCES